MLDTPYKIYMMAAAADIYGDGGGREYVRQVQRVSRMLVVKSRLDWMALPRI
jgi:hypothetical protein